MLGWLKRWLGGGKPAAATASGAARPAANAPTGPATAAADTALVPAGQQQALVGRSGQVAGFVLRLSASVERRLAGRSDGTPAAPSAPAALAAHWALLFAAARALQQQGRDVLLQVPAAVLQRPGLADQVPAGVLLLPLQAPDPTATDADPWATTVRTLRARGVRVGLPDGPAATAPDADFVLLQASAGGSDTLLLSAQRWQEARPRLPLVALGLDNVDDIERALAAGITLAGGRLQGAAGATRPAASPRPLHAAAHRICTMLNDLALDRDTAAVADAVRADVALSYRLLRYANSPALGQTRSIDTIEQAVLLLGRAELARWLSVMLLSAAGGRQASAALQEHALARGRLLEALAAQQGDGAPQRLFTVGLLSRLDLLLHMPLAAALQPLRLADDAAQALLQRRGPWAPYLALADALEGDDEALVQSLSLPFGGLDAVLAQARLAWAWAAQMQGG